MPRHKNYDEAPWWMWLLALLLALWKPDKPRKGGRPR